MSANSNQKSADNKGILPPGRAANIVFYSMQQMFGDVLASEKLSRITDLPENVAIFDGLRKEREELERRFVAREEQREGKSEPEAQVNFDKLLGDVTAVL